MKEKDTILDRLNLATIFPQTLRPGGSKEVRDALTGIFPWLTNFGIIQDGSPLRWLATDSSDPERGIVFPHRARAEAQVRDWILEFFQQFVPEEGE